MLELVHPEWFWALLILLPYLAYEIFFKHKRRVRLRHSRIDVLKQISGYNWIYNFFPILLRILVIILLIVALARPRLALKRQQITGKGVDIMLAIDVSGSMQAVDFQPVNRLEAAKEVAIDFIDRRRNDRIGLIVFAENAYTQCPLTLDYNILMSIMEKIEINKEASGTAIGMGLATAAARLSQSQAKSKVIILITDGRNNAGEIDPLYAAELAATYEIKVYPIGVGSKGLVDYPFQTPFGIQYRKVNIEIDMDTLNQIAQMTGTESARLATNTAELESIMAYIDEMEKTEIKINDYYVYQEMFWRYLLLAFILLFIEFLFRIVFRKELP